MSDLEAMIRAELNPGQSRSGWFDLARALQGVLDVERADRRFVRADDPETTRWMMGWDECLDEVRKIIASALSIQEGGSTDG